MLSMADFAGWKTKRTTVRLGDREIQIRALSMKDRARAEVAAGVMPVPPLKPNPNKGSLALLEPDERDPEYLRQRQQWLRRLAAAQVALMTEYQTVAMLQSQRATASDEDIKAAVEEVLDVLPEMAVEYLIDQQHALVEGAMLGEGKGAAGGDGSGPLKN